MLVFGPCLPCAPADLVKSFPIDFIDDLDLELDHAFSIDFMSVDPSGVTTGGSLPLTQTIADNGQSLNQREPCTYHSVSSPQCAQISQARRN